MGGDDREGRGQRAGHAVHRDLSFLHGLQQGALGLGRGAVDLVGQEQIAEGRAGAVFKAAGGTVIDGKPHHVGGHDFRGKLHPVIEKAHGPGKGQGKGGLPDAGIVLQQDVPAGQDRHEHLADHRILADDRLAHFGHDLHGLGLGQLDHENSSLYTEVQQVYHRFARKRKGKAGSGKSDKKGLTKSTKVWYTAHVSKNTSRSADSFL